MKKISFILILIVAITVGQRDIHSNQPNGQPWSENSYMEPNHEMVERGYEIAAGSPEGCGFICEWQTNLAHEAHYETEELSSEAEEDEEFSEWWEDIFGGAMHQ